MIASEARGAWQDIERRLRPYVARRVASAGDVDDILQEIFVRMHRGLSSLRDGESFGGWVYRVAQSAIADAARARARSVLVCPASSRVSPATSRSITPGSVAEPGSAIAPSSIAQIRAGSTRRAPNGATCRHAAAIVIAASR